MRHFRISSLLPVLLALIHLGGSFPAWAQPEPGTDLVRVPGIQQNSVTVLQAQGDSLWVGPRFNLTPDGGQTYQAVQNVLLEGTENRVFALDAEGGVVVAGIGFTGAVLGEPEPAVAGFVYSRDGGRTFAARSAQIESSAADTLVRYGVSTLNAYPVLLPEQGPPFGVDYDDATGTIWVAGDFAGLRRSHIDSTGWRRVVLPPDDRGSIHPDSQYSFRLDPRGGQEGNYNHQVVSVLVDETGTVWAGTPLGVNRSTDGGVSWRRFSYDGTPGGLVGNYVAAIEEQPLPGRNAVWLATWSSFEAGPQTRYGITVTRDGGETYEQVFVSGAEEAIRDFAFDGETVYAAGGGAGLFISDDGGATWRTVRDFSSSLQPGRFITPEAVVQAVAVAGGALWVGTSEGLFKSTDGGANWQVFRADVPTNPEQPTEAVPDVETYAYPNPFSPDEAPYVTRIRYELSGASSVEIRIFDFEMSLVRRLEEAGGVVGGNETAWDGTGDNGLRVANGVYFYSVRAVGRTMWGKIMVLQ